MTISRRGFLAYSGGTALSLYVYNNFGIPVAMGAPIPGGTLNPSAVPKFALPLIVPPAMPTSGPNTYDVAVRQFAQQIKLNAGVSDAAKLPVRSKFVRREER